MVMAAGLGTRLRPFTDFVPKPLIRVMGVPTCQFAFDLCASVPIRKIVANFHYLPSQSERGLRSLDTSGLDLILSDERDLLLGSAGGIRKVLPELGSLPFYLVNADTISNIDLKKLMSRHLRLRDQWGVTMTLAVGKLNSPGHCYREIQIDSHSGIIRGLGNSQEGVNFYTGVAVIEPEWVDRLKDGVSSDFVKDLLEPAILEGKAGSMIQDPLNWIDVGTPALWLRAHLEMIQGLETGNLPNRWRRRVESVSQRVTDGIWVSKQPSGQILGMINTLQWIGPCYFSGSWNAAEGVSCPAQLGPNAALYLEKKHTSQGEYSNGIGINGVWQAVDEVSG